MTHRVIATDTTVSHNEEGSSSVVKDNLSAERARKLAIEMNARQGSDAVYQYRAVER